MNLRERFLGTFSFKDVDRVPDYEFGYWTETIDRWHREGLPFEKRSNRDIELYFGLEGFMSTETLPFKGGLWPPLPERIIKEEGDRATIDDGMGGMYIRPASASSIPHYIRYPIKTRADWEQLKPFFDPGTPGRFPLNWNSIAESYRERDYPLGIKAGSLYGWLRNLMGVETISIAFYKDPDWIAEMMDTLVNLTIKNIRRALSLVKVDFAHWWEDMCYSRGPLLSVRHFEEFMVPRYKKIADVLKEYGVTINILDSDGDVTLLVPGWLKAGINCMFPVEARFTDINELRKAYGHRVLFLGGVDKMPLIAGEKAIDTELKRLTPVLEDGGFIPTLDHFVPPEVSYAMYKYYLKKKRGWIGRNGLST